MKQMTAAHRSNWGAKPLIQSGANAAKLAPVFRSLCRHFIPVPLSVGGAVYRLLAETDRRLLACQSSAGAVGIADEAKADLGRVLASHFAPAVAQALALKVLNICLARRHFRLRSAALASRPFGLIVDPANLCGLACPGCVHSARSEALELFDWPKVTLAEERFASLLRTYGPYAIGVYFCNYGEPLLNRKTPELIRMAKRYLTWTALSTSLSVRRFEPEAYVRSGLDFMVLSIDGATQAVYERFRRNGNLELVFENVRKLVAARRELRKRTPVLSWNFLAFEHNAHEIPAAARLARRLGVDHFRVVNPFDVGWEDPGIRAAPVKARVRRWKWLSFSHLPENWNPFPDEVDTLAIAHAFEDSWPRPAGDDAAPGPGHTCHWLYKNMVMDAAGRILPCCGAPGRDGSLVFAALEPHGGDAFNSERYRQARSFLAGAAPAAPGAPYCTRCEWDHATVNIGGPEIRRYFRAAGAALFDRCAVRLLSSW